MNVVALIGNVASDPELRHAPSGRAVCTFRLAVSRPGSDGADFVTIVTWERQAEVCAEYLSQGRRVAVEGRIHCTRHQGSNGEMSSTVEVVASRVELLGARPATVAEVFA